MCIAQQNGSVTPYDIYHLPHQLFTVDTNQGNERALRAAKALGSQPSNIFATASPDVGSTHGPSYVLPWPGVYFTASTLMNFPPDTG